VDATHGKSSQDARDLCHRATHSIGWWRWQASSTHSLTQLLATYWLTESLRWQASVNGQPLAAGLTSSVFFLPLDPLEVSVKGGLTSPDGDLLAVRQDRCLDRGAMSDSLLR